MKQTRMNTDQHETDFFLLIDRREGWVMSRLLLITTAIAGRHPPLVLEIN